MGIPQDDCTPDGRSNLDPALSALQRSPFIVTQHEQRLDLFQGRRAKDFGTHLRASGLGIELGSLDGVISSL
jgi:hypothetical protein